ncbi:MAG: WD40 repeat domain-containing protein [Pseudonocardia sp.]
MPLIETLATAIASKAAESVATELVKDLAGVQAEQLALLRGIRQDVQKLLNQPWRKAGELIDEAAHARDEPARRGKLLAARDSLLDALSLEPEETPQWATVAVNLALVDGMLGDREHAARRATRAHRAQCAAVAAAVPAVTALLNSRAAAARAWVDGDFWSLVATSRKEDPAGAERWLREKYERGEAARTMPPADFMPDLAAEPDPAEGAGQLWRGLSGRRGLAAHRDHVRRWAWEGMLAAPDGGATRRRPFLSHIAIAETTTAAGRELMRLHRVARQVPEYRRVRLAFAPAADVPVHRLVVDLSRPRRAWIGWEPEPASPGLELTWRGGDEPTSSVAFTPDGNLIVLGSGRTARILDASGGNEIGRLTHGGTLHGPIWGVAVSPDSELIATAGADHTVRVWRWRERRVLHTLVHLSVLGYVRSVVFSPDGIRLASAAGDRTVRVWDARTGAETLRVTHDKPAWSVGFSPDGERIVSGSEGGSVRVWDARSGAPVLAAGPFDVGHDAAFSPDGRLIAVGGVDARILDGSTGRAVSRHGYGFSVAFSPDGRLLALGGIGRTRVVEVATGAEVACFTDGDAVVDDVAFSPDGRRLATVVSDSRAMRVWAIVARAGGHPDPSSANT